MKCKYCGCEAEEGLRFCPDCGMALAEDTEQEAAAATPEEAVAAADAPEDTVVTDEAPEEAVETDEAPEEAVETAEPVAEGEQAPEEAPAAAEGKPAEKKNPLLIATIVLSSIAIILLCVLLWRQANPKPAEQTPEEAPTAESTTEPEAAPAYVSSLFTLDNEDLSDDVLDTVIATCGEVTLTNRSLPYYYWDSFNNMSYYLYYYGFNIYGNLDEQQIAENQSLGEYMLDYTLYYFNMYAGLYTDAVKADFVMTEEFQSSLDNLRSDMETYAKDYGYASVDDYLVKQYGPTATFEDYYAYQEIYLTAMGYWESLCDAHEISDEELNSYWQENETSLTASGIQQLDLPNVNVRHILLMPADIQLAEEEEGYEAEKQAVWAEALAKAEDIYKQWKTGEATEDSFAALADEFSQDPGSNTTGGLYEDVYPGQMVEAFNDWCFDEDRAVGDTGIVETDYGYHIMYFSGVTDTVYWKSYVRDMLLEDFSGELQRDVSARYTMDSHTEGARLYASNIQG